MSDWTEQWAMGEGASRIYCGIARTEEGYAVDVFRGDTCVDSFPYPRRRDAVAHARMLRLEFVDGLRLSQAPLFTGEPGAVTAPGRRDGADARGRQPRAT